MFSLCLSIYVHIYIYTRCIYRFLSLETEEVLQLVKDGCAITPSVSSRLVLLSVSELFMQKKYLILIKYLFFCINFTVMSLNALTDDLINFSYFGALLVYYTRRSGVWNSLALYIVGFSRWKRMRMKTGRWDMGPFKTLPLQNTSDLIYLPIFSDTS